VLFFQPALGVLQPLTARARNRPSLRRTLVVESPPGVAQPGAPALRARQMGRQLIAAPLPEALVLLAVDRVGLGQDLLGDPA
jgi:hypothetical protein